MAVPSTPTGVSSTLLDPNFSNQATHGGSSPAPSLPNSPVAFVRQNAQDFPAEDEDSQQTLPYLAGAGSVPTGADVGGEGDDHDDPSSDHSESDNESKHSAVLLDGDSDSDVDLPMDERLKVRKGWLHQEWRDLKSHNESFGVGCTDWDSYLHDGLQDHGYRLINGSWVKTGPPTMRNKIQRMQETARVRDMKRTAGSWTVKKVHKSSSSSSKTPVKSVKSMKAMKSSPMKSPMKSMKAMKASPKSKIGKAGRTSPQTPVKSKNPKACDLVTPPRKAVLSTPPKAPGKGKRALKGWYWQSPLPRRVLSLRRSNPRPSRAEHWFEVRVEE